MVQIKYTKTNTVFSLKLNRVHLRDVDLYGTKLYYFEENDDRKKNSFIVYFKIYIF